MEATEAIYNLKRCIKQIKSVDIDMNALVSGLQKVRQYLYGISRKALGDELRVISRSLVSDLIDHRIAVIRLDNVIRELKKIREKNCIMRQRRCQADMRFNDEGLRKKKRNWGCTEVDALSRYDVILAPTQGGFHFCIISDVEDGDHVIAYPMTTASNSDLNMLGCRSYSLKKIIGPHSRTSLTSAATKVPFCTALRSFVEKLPYSPELEKALSYVRHS